MEDQVNNSKNNKYFSKTYLTIALVIVEILILYVYSIFLKNHKDPVIVKTPPGFEERVGSIPTFLNFDIVSFDTGRTWYIKDGGKILGNVEEMRPGTLSYLNSFDSLRTILRNTTGNVIDSTNYEVLSLLTNLTKLPGFKNVNQVSNKKFNK